ncbi:MAG: nonstructural protein [Microvirus sp.]|nr:MAG: nonstructural protein [Microvirus sp.]
MIYTVCAIRDHKSGAYGRPFVAPSQGVAIRSFDDEVNRATEDNLMFHHAEDFALFNLGIYNDETGTFDTGNPELLIAGDQVKRGQLHRNGITAV